MRKIAIFWMTITAGATAQNFDNSANGKLTGDYFVRQVLLSGVSTQGAVGRAQSIAGTATFDGNGNYTFSGQIADSQTAGPQPYASSGKYSLAPNGLFQIQNPIDIKDIDYGGVGAAGPSAIVASATGGSYHDILVAIPAGSNVSSSSFAGAYNCAFLDFARGNSKTVRDGYFALSADGQGNLGNLTINGSAADQNSLPTTQTASGATYSFTANGSGTINLGSGASLLNGSKNFYISRDGNILLGGSPGGFDILVGAKAVTPPASNGIFLGTFYLAGIEEDASDLSQNQSLIDSFYGSVNANGQGASIWHNRLDAAGQAAYDNTYDDVYSVTRNGTYQTDFFQYLWGAGGQAVLIVGRQDEYYLTIGFQTPNFAGTDMLLNPIGIVNAASLAPITNAVAPGEFVTLVGSGLSSTTLEAPVLPLPTTLGGVQVKVNGRLAALSYVSPTQLNVLVPFATVESYATFQAINNGSPSNTVTVYAGQTAPGVFTTTQNGIGPGAVLDSHYSPVRADNPASIGDTIQIFVTGLGAVTPTVPDGTAAPSSPLSLVNADVSVFIDDQPAQVLFKGLSPGSAGLYQINVVVPGGVSTGEVYLDVSTAGAYTSEAKIYIQ